MTGDAAATITRAPARGVPSESRTRPLIEAKSLAAVLTRGKKRTMASARAIAEKSGRMIFIVSPLVARSGVGILPRDLTDLTHSKLPSRSDNVLCQIVRNLDQDFVLPGFEVG